MNRILYFSPTGNAKYIAEKLAERLNDDYTALNAIELIDPGTLEKADKLIIIFSIHAFNPPRTVSRFVRKLPEGLADSVSLVAVGCSESWVNNAAASGIRCILEKKGYSVGTERVIAMPLTFIISFPDEIAGKLIADADRKMAAVAGDIEKEIQSGGKICLKSKVLHFIGKAEDPAARLFGLDLYAGKSCSSCGICVRGCPEKNIRFNKRDIPVFRLRCIMCMRCIYNCPEKAIGPRINRFIPLKGGYSIKNYIKGN